MARNISNRLNQLRARRKGLDRINRVEPNERAIVTAKSLLQEAYEKRSNLPHTRYALGAMEEVGPDYTRIGIEEAERVGKQLSAGLAKQGIDIDLRLQGSVPCNIHIRGVSDVDLLAIHMAFHTYDRTGRSSLAGHYNNPTPYTPVSALKKLRSHSEIILTEKFPAADVDTTAGKAIKISGGSLRRPVDVVPSHWHDTADYQLSNQEVDRGIYVLDTKIDDTLLNMPFRHIRRIGEHDELSWLNLKKAIRLCKHVKSDAQDEGTKVELPSFDLASVMWYADLAALRLGSGYELAVLAEARRHLNALASNPNAAQQLRVPDGSREIFDTRRKWDGLLQLVNWMISQLKSHASRTAASRRHQRKLLGVKSTRRCGRRASHQQHRIASLAAAKTSPVNSEMT